VTETALRLEPEVPSELLAGRYRLGDKLGEGGMGAVYRATEIASGRVVALKRLLSTMAGAKRASAEALFEREYHTLVRLKHPRIIEVYDYGLTPDGPFYTMELLDGQDLVKAAPLPFKEVCRVLRDIASSLALIHAHRLLHRDVSPRNVRLTAQGAKLIDFGALAPFGASADVIGTPTCMAPEILNCQVLDQRTDLYALGAVAYWALTRRNAYAARRLNELQSAWKTPPAPPSELVPGIPPALDTLVLSLLSLDPMARPANAAAVIDQLTVIGELTPEEHEQTADHYLHSGRMVGRKEEVTFIQRAFTRLLRGTGGELVVDGAPGIGKTRLLQEVALEAQLKGIAVLKSDAQANPEPFGLAVALSMNLLAVSPDLARRLAEPHASTLAHLSADLRRKLGDPELAASSPDHAERRARVQTALHEWFLAFSRTQPVVLAIDNLQAADDNSAAFLAALGRKAKRARLVILATQRMGDKVEAPLAVKALRKRSNGIKLGALAQDAFEELVASLFGNVENAGRMAKLLFERSAGNPQQGMALAQLLVKKQIAKYVAGTWVLPFTVSIRELPSRVEQVAALRCASLSPLARRIADGLSVYTKPLPIEKCLALVENATEQEVFAALDELVSEQVLSVDKNQYRFAQQSLREAVLQQMDDARRRRLHLHAAEALLASAQLGIGLRIEAAWHLMRAGEEGRGADLMVSAGREFQRNESMTESPAQVVEALHTAAMVYEKQQRSDYELATLLFPLVTLGFHIDWHVTLKYAERAIDIGLRITGLGLAQKLSRFLGRKLGLIVALVIAGVRFGRQKKRGLKYDLRQAIGAFCGIVPAAVATHAICYETDKVRQLTAKLEPLRLFGEGHIATLMHDFAGVQVSLSEGRELEGRMMLEQLLVKFEAPHVAATLGEGHFKSIYGGILFGLGTVYPYQFGDTTLQIAERMEKLGVRTWAMGADQIRLLHHAFRGETERVQYYRERVELYAVQGGTSWQTEVFWPVLLLAGDTLAGDTIAVRRAAEQLARRAEDVPGLSDYAQAAHAIYLYLRGNLEEAVFAFEAILPKLTPRQRVAWHSIRAFYADALNRAGEPERAKRIAEEVLQRMVPGEEVMVLRFLEPERQLALAEAGLGNHARAAQILDALLMRHAKHDNPLLMGLLHKARTEVAFGAGERELAELHLTQFEQLARAARNPAAIAQWERLFEKLHRGDRSAARANGDGKALDDAVSVMTQKVHSELCAADDPFACALALVMARTKSRAAYLYVVKENKTSVVSASSPIEPPLELERLLVHQITRLNQRAQEELSQQDPEGRTVTAYVETTPPAPSDTHQLVVLSTELSGVSTAVGGLILEVGTPVDPMDHHFVDAIATGLADLLIKTATTF
jgi:tetratricopeptide (TPR) repeat protein/tRNA A-37 threonylcarbamoyl transferase component Bud32